MTSLYDITLNRLDGSPLALSELQGKLLLIVNTASECGLTPQYQGLETLHQAYQAQGLVVIGCPCNQFGGQEPGDAEAIGQFCSQNYGVSFLLSEKLAVNGPDTHPLFQFLKAEQPGILGTEAIKWNFTKFLVSQQGDVIGRYAPTTSPESLRDDIEKALGR
jgi:glutathione peroxidase